MKFKLLLIVALMIGLTHRYGEAYSLKEYRWPTATFEYYINPNSSDVSQNDAIEAVKSGANAWSPWCRGIYKGTTTDKKIRNNGINTVFFRSREYGAIASTYTFHKRDKLLSFHIVFWDGGWNLYGNKDTCVDGFYIADTAAHEFGHAIGLGHSRIKNATMYPHSGYCNATLVTLAKDDKKAATMAYENIVQNR
jgi:Matrixin